MPEAIEYGEPLELPRDVYAPADAGQSREPQATGAQAAASEPGRNRPPETTPAETRFTDAENRVWRIDLTFGLAKHILERHDVDLIDPDPAKAFAKLADPRKAVEVIWSLVERQAREGFESEVGEDEFYDALDAAAVDAAAVALEAAVVGFSPRHRRPYVRAAIERIHEAEAKAAEALAGVAAGEQVTEAIDTIVSQMTKTAGDRMKQATAEALGEVGRLTKAPRRHTPRRGPSPDPAPGG
ncbi:MAG: hypothetical protein AAF805_00225 [Planctomycetota bacterium]